MLGIYRTIISSAHFTAVFYLLARPAFSVWYQYALIGLNFYCLYGICSAISMIFSRQDSPLVAIFIGLVAGAFCGFAPALKGTFNTIAFAISPNRWAADTQFGLWAGYYEGVYDVPRGAELFGYELHQVSRNLCIMLALGTGFRVLAYILMISLQRSKQR